MARFPLSTSRLKKQIGTIDYGRGVRPHFGVCGADGMFYVTTERSRG
jgi:hypothetical protein